MPDTSNDQRQFTVFSTLLHWLMVLMIGSMLAIGLKMVVSLKHYGTLLSIHRPLGIAVLLVAAIRLVNRLLNPPPPFPVTVPPMERIIASTSEKVMYTLMFILPLVGWGMLSAERYPIVMFGPVHLPFILPHDPTLYAVLRKTHTILAYLFLFTILGHLSAILYHTLILRDGLLYRMSPWRVSPDRIAPPDIPAVIYKSSTPSSDR